MKRTDGVNDQPPGVEHVDLIVLMGIFWSLMNFFIYLFIWQYWKISCI
jgi:hypothetical protein